TAVVLMATWWKWAALLVAVTSDLSTAPADSFAVLAPPLSVYLTNYRIVLSVLAAANLAGWYALTRASRSGPRLPASLAFTELIVLILLYGSLQMPYRFIHDDTAAFPMVTWRGERCHVLGQRPDDSLLFCPRLSPRNRIVARSERFEPSDARESIYA